jgi:hypothetical protein
MGIKIVVNSSGLFQVPVAGSSVQFEMPNVVESMGPLTPPSVVAEDDGVTAGGASFVLLQPASNAVTASLPAITAGLVGRQYTFMNTDATQDMVLSGTNNVGGVTWERAFANAYSTATVMAVSSSGGFYWHVISSV